MMKPALSRTLRSQVRAAIAAIVVLSVLLFAVPLAVAVGRLFESQTVTRLQRDATRGVAGVPDNVLEVGSRVQAPRGSPGTDLGVYDASGQLVSGRGPARSELALLAGNGREHDGHDHGALAVAVPVLSDTSVAGSVRAAVPLSQLHRRVLGAWGLLAVLGMLVLVVAMLLARRAAGQISEPFEQLTAAARALGDGRFDVLLPRFGIAEADVAADALRASASSIDQLVQQERDFVQHASHQLRTPLAGLLVHLDRDRPDVGAALERAQYLETTIADLLAIRALSGTAHCDPGAVATEAVHRWRTADRTVVLRVDDTGPVGLPASGLRQCLDVLLDNAVRHGAGPVTVTCEPHGDVVSVEVTDSGHGFPAGFSAGTGLNLATGIVQRAGGSLIIRRRGPGGRVVLLLPADKADKADPAVADTSAGLTVGPAQSSSKR